MTVTRKQIGTVAVDTGSIMVIDPCYANKVLPQIQKVHDQSSKAPDFAGGVIPANDGTTMLATVFATRLGDGRYPVFAELDEQGKLVRVVIEMKD